MPQTAPIPEIMLTRDGRNKPLNKYEQQLALLFNTRSLLFIDDTTCKPVSSDDVALSFNFYLEKVLLQLLTAMDINKINLLTEIKVANGEIFLNDFGENWTRLYGENCSF